MQCSTSPLNNLPSCYLIPHNSCQHSREKLSRTATSALSRSQDKSRRSCSTQMMTPQPCCPTITSPKVQSKRILTTHVMNLD